MSELQTALQLITWGMYLGFGGIVGAKLAVHAANGLANLLARLGITRAARTQEPKQ